MHHPHQLTTDGRRGVGNRGRRLLAVWSAALLALLLASSCGGDDLDPRLTAIVDDESIESPLAHLFLVDTSSPASLAETQRVAEEAIRDCMSEKGFVYLPVVVPESSVAGLEDLPPQDSLEFVQQYGYGATLLAERELAMISAGSDLVNDPNEEVKKALSETELAAYERALNGMDSREVRWRESDGAPLDPATGEVMAEGEFMAKASTGCAYKAYFSDEVQATSVAADLFTSDLYADLQSRISNDPDLLRLLDGWAVCMNGEGYRYASPEEARGEFQARAEGILAEATDEERPTVHRVTAVQLNELRLEEVAAALADWDCSAELFNQAPKIARQHEVAFIKQHETLVLGLLERSRS